jgi:antiphage defense system Thoeris ThsB-like protein
VARRVYFAFDYQDIWEVNQIRKSGEFVDVAVAGFHDASQWEELREKDDATIKKAIDDALVGTSVTVVCVGERTANRKYVKYELTQSKARGNGLLGVFLPGESGHAKPAELGDAQLYGWDSAKFAERVEAAAAAAGH